ncbi:MAG: transposase, partial [Dehalococcoidia bacterium]
RPRSCWHRQGVGSRRHHHRPIAERRSPVTGSPRPGASPRPSADRSTGRGRLSGTYRPRDPGATVFHTIVREHLETFLEEGRSIDGEGYPAFVEQAFRKFLSCGVLCHGFARLKCSGCGHERLVGFSCKSVVCPSCQGRRMAEMAAYARDQLLPEAEYRQFVLTVPWKLRYRLSVDRKLMSAVLRAFLQTVFRWQRRRGRERGIGGGETGALSYLHRMGGALNSHSHIHSILPDGLFAPRADGEDLLRFVSLPGPSREELTKLLERIARRITKLVEKVAEEEADCNSLEETAASMQAALARSMSAPSPADQLVLATEDHEEGASSSRTLCAKVAGFTLHAGRVVPLEDRDSLEQLCKYGLRAPFSQERLRLREDGTVVYELSRPWPNSAGVTELVLDPVEFLQRVAALIPRPYTHQIRRHGVFAGRSKHRWRLPPPPVRPELEEEDASSESSQETGKPGSDSEGGVKRPRTKYTWAQLIRRSFFADCLRCPRCAATMTVVSYLTDPDVIRRILGHLGLPTTTAPVLPSRVGSGLGGWDEPGPSEEWESPEEGEDRWEERAPP